MNLQDRRVLVTGASGGIGRALVSALLDGGAQVLLSGRDHRALSRVVEHHDARHRTAVFAADIAIASDRARLCDFACRWHGGIDILINNAAVSDFCWLAAQSEDSLDDILSTNLLAPIDLCRRLIPCLERSEQARIVNIGSVFGSIGFAGNSVYSASKFGLRGFSEALRRELADTSVRVQYVAPRSTRTAFNSDRIDQMNAALGNVSDEPEKVARTIVCALQADKLECVIGWPEKFFARVNAVLPRVVDMALLKKLATIRHFAARSTSKVHPTDSFISTTVRPREIL